MKRYPHYHRMLKGSQNVRLHISLTIWINRAQFLQIRKLLLLLLVKRGSPTTTELKRYALNLGQPSEVVLCFCTKEFAKCNVTSQKYNFGKAVVFISQQTENTGKFFICNSMKSEVEENELYIWINLFPLYYEWNTSCIYRLTVDWCHWSHMLKLSDKTWFKSVYYTSDKPP